MEKDKIAFLITAHSDFEQLKKLCASLDYPKFDIYIHINKLVRVNIKKLDIKLKYANVFILKKRVKVHWGGYSLFTAILKMYKYAFKKSIYCRYVNLSGLDYPIKANDVIYKTLIDDTKEFIIGSPLFKNGYHKVSNKYYFDINGKIKIKLLGFAQLIKLKFFNSLVIKKRINPGPYPALYIKNDYYPVFFSCTWLGLSDNFIEYFLNIMNKNKKIKRYFKYSYVPDELLIATIFFNSPFKDKALGFITDESLHYNNYPALHYLNYEPVIEVYDEYSYDKIINSKKLFVRKVTSEKSTKLIEMIDKYRMG